MGPIPIRQGSIGPVHVFYTYLAQSHFSLLVNNLSETIPLRDRFTNSVIFLTAVHIVSKKILIIQIIRRDGINSRSVNIFIIFVLLNQKAINNNVARTISIQLNRKDASKSSKDNAIKV